MSGDLLFSEDLLYEAARAQKQIRQEKVHPDDLFLVTAASTPPRSHGVSGVTPITGNLEERLLDRIAADNRATRSTGKNATQVLQVFSAQRPNAVLDFKTRVEGKLAYSDMFLPGRASLVDHLAVYLENSKDWSKFLPVVNKLRGHRIPALRDVPSPWEVIIGETPDSFIRQTTEMLRLKAHTIRQEYGFCVFALDTESVGIIKEPGAFVREPNGSIFLRLPTREKRSAESFAVRLMVGHLDFHVQVSLPFKAGQCDRLGDVLVLDHITVQPALQELFDALGMVVGVRVEQDVRDFFSSLTQIFGSSAPVNNTIRPIELGALARYAGYNLQRYSMWMLNWCVYGGILAKGECSCGDGQWARNWSSISKPLQAYAYGDVAQAAGIAWVFIFTWVVHRFPDAHLLRQVSFLDQNELLGWWVDKIVPRVNNAAVGWHSAATPAELISRHAGEDGIDRMIRKFIPDWPSIPAGGPRFNHAVRAFTLDNFKLLSEAQPAAFRSIDRNQALGLVFGRWQFRNRPSPIDPVEGLGMKPHPLAGSGLTGSPAQICTAALARCRGGGVSARSLILEYARFDPQSGREFLVRLESDRKARDVIKVNHDMATAIVRDLRVLLSALGMTPSRPEGWQDLYPFAKEQVDRIVDMARAQGAAEMEAGTRRMLQGQDKLMTARVIKRKRGEIVNGSWIPPPVLSGRNIDAAPLSEAAVANIGVSRPPPAKKKKGGDSVKPGTSRMVMEVDPDPEDTATAPVPPRPFDLVSFGESQGGPSSGPSSGRASPSGGETKAVGAAKEDLGSVDVWPESSGWQPDWPASDSLTEEVSSDRPQRRVIRDYTYANSPPRRVMYDESGSDSSIEVEMREVKFVTSEGQASSGKVELDPEVAGMFRNMRALLDKVASLRAGHPPG